MWVSFQPKPRLDVEQDTSWLHPEEYQMIVAPSLKVAAELAATRGDPKLYQDMPSMLCLIHLVKTLADFYREEWAALESMSSEQSLTDAPMASCAMVLAEGGVDQSHAGNLLSALERAYQQIDEAGLTQAVNIEIHLAWRAMTESRFEQFMAMLEQAAKKLVGSIEAWEKTR